MENLFENLQNLFHIKLRWGNSLSILKSDTRSSNKPLFVKLRGIGHIHYRKFFLQPPPSPQKRRTNDTLFTIRIFHLIITKNNFNDKEFIYHIQISMVQYMKYRQNINDVNMLNAQYCCRQTRTLLYMLYFQSYFSNATF